MMGLWKMGQNETTAQSLGEGLSDVVLFCIPIMRRERAIGRGMSGIRSCDCSRKGAEELVIESFFICLKLYIAIVELCYDMMLPHRSF